MKKIIAFSLGLLIGLTAISGCSKKLSSTSTDPNVSVTFPTGITEPTQVEEKEPETFEELYGNQLMNYINHQYVFDGEEIPLTESNFYVIDAFVELSQYALYGYYPATTLGYVDLAAECEDPEYKTYGDYLIDYAENSIHSTYILNKRAAADDMTLSDDTKAEIDKIIEDIKNNEAAQANKSLDDYLSMYYGPGMNAEAFKAILEHYYISEAYTNDWYDNYSFDSKTGPNVKYALFYAPEDDSQANKDKAKSEAEAMKNACKSVEAFEEYEENVQTIYDHGTIVIAPGETVDMFNDWAFDEKRKEGDIDIIYAPEYGYFVVGYAGQADLTEDSLKNIALDALYTSIKEDIESNKYGFGTSFAYTPAPAAPTPTPIPEKDLYSAYEDWT